jgi:hypothetical protein
MKKRIKKDEVKLALCHLMMATLDPMTLIRGRSAAYAALARYGHGVISVRNLKPRHYEAVIKGCEVERKRWSRFHASCPDHKMPASHNPDFVKVQS